jgi:hypothetical protein
LAEKVVAVELEQRVCVEENVHDAPEKNNEIDLRHQGVGREHESRKQGGGSDEQLPGVTDVYWFAVANAPAGGLDEADPRPECAEEICRLAHAH